MTKAHLEYGYTLAKIGKVAELRYATVSRIENVIIQDVTPISLKPYVFSSVGMLVISAIFGLISLA